MNLASHFSLLNLHNHPLSVTHCIHSNHLLEMLYIIINCFCDYISTEAYNGKSLQRS